MNIIKKALVIAVTIFLASCGGTNKLTKNQQKELGEEQYQVCSEEESNLQGLYFTGIGQGQSINSQMSQKMAKAEARIALAGMMDSFVKEDIKKIASQSQQGEDPSTDYSDAWEMKGQQLISKRLQGSSTFCSKTFKNKEGLYTSYIGLKLDIKKAVFLQQIKEELISSSN